MHKIMIFFIEYIVDDETMEEKVILNAKMWYRSI